MSLAARCPACATVFRVVQDQLRVSDGWVRCGRCAEVFNATQNLVDLEADGISLPSTGRPAPDRLAGESVGAASQARDERPEDPQRHDTDDAGDAAADPAARPPSSMPAAPAAEELRAGPALRPDPAYAPSFVRRAERAARWRRPAVRVALALATAAAAVGLAAQAGFVYRDLVAARWPLTRPWLERACGAIGCAIEAPRAIDALTVESSGLLRIDGTTMYKLSVVLRNRAALVLAVPSVDLTLTDSQGSVIARRVITAAELGARGAGVPALAELALQATLGAGERAISGYTIEIFYP